MPAGNLRERETEASEASRATGAGATRATGAGATRTTGGNGALKAPPPGDAGRRTER